MVARYLLRRAALAIPVLFIVVLAVFSLIHLTPGNPAAIMLGEEASPSAVALLAHRLGLDRPIPVQFVHWLGAVLHGNLGTSLVYSEPVTHMIVDRLPVTLELTLVSMLLSLLIAVPLGIASARWSNTWVDYASRLIAMIGVSLPNFWLALLLIYAFAVHFQIFPATGFVPLSQGLGANLYSLALPSLTLALGLAGVTMRLLRAELLESLSQLYMRTARAKGATERRVVMRHALKNALIPVITVIGLQFGGLMGGVVITESIFSLPGIGGLLVGAIFDRDFPLVQGTVLFIALVVIAINLCVDVGYAFIDPRIKYA